MIIGFEVYIFKCRKKTCLRHYFFVEAQKIIILCFIFLHESTNDIVFNAIIFRFEELWTLKMIKSIFVMRQLLHFTIFQNGNNIEACFERDVILN